MILNLNLVSERVYGYTVSVVTGTGTESGGGEEAFRHFIVERCPGPSPGGYQFLGITYINFIAEIYENKTITLNYGKHLKNHSKNPAF
jgi:hypothetical protein